MVKPSKYFKKVQRAILFALGLPKTLLFNFYYFPLIVAIRLPVFVSHRVWLMELSGACELAHVRTGIVKIGYGEVGIFDRRRSRTIWQVSGRVRFNGSASIGHGSKISVCGNLTVGDRFLISAESAIVAHHSIFIGAEVLISWDVLIMDTDFHAIFDREGGLINPNRPILIGNKVWIGCRALILKGVEIADGVVIAAASTISKSVSQQGVVMVGDRIAKESISWEM